MNRSPKIVVIAPGSLKRPSKIRRLVNLILGLGLIGGPLVFAFAFAAKYTEEYSCVLKFVQADQTVLQTVGEPVEPGLFAWSSYFALEGSVRQIAFSFDVTGPKGRGQVEATSYRAPTGSFITIRFEAQEIYNGIYSCP